MKTATSEHWYEKGFAPIVIIIGIALLAGAGFLAVNSQQSLQDSCAKGWQDYKNETFSLEFKIPAGWTDDSIDERQTETTVFRRLISTTRPEEQVDPKFAISTFDVIASKSDLKYDQDYKGLFNNYPDNSQLSQVSLHGLPAEKVVFDITQPAGNFHGEKYYFKKGDIYYYLSLGIYTTPDLKAKNEAILKCFLENFRILEPEEEKEDIVDGMKLFTSQKLQLKIRYPKELFAYEWKSDDAPNYNSERPAQDRNIIQFFKNEDLKGDKITISRDTNVQRKTAKDFAKAYWSAREEDLKHWKPGSIDFVIFGTTYLTPLGDWMYIFEADGGLQQALGKMLPTLKFTGTGEAFSKDLIPCPDNLLSTTEEINKQQEDWWEKPDRCDNSPEQKICGYVRSIFDNGMMAFSNSDYRSPYCYCSFFDKSGSRTFRGTEMFALGYEEGACKEKIK